MKLAALKPPHSVMSSLSHPVDLIKFINSKNFICAICETSPRKQHPINAVIFVYNKSNLRRRSTVSSSFTTCQLELFLYHSIGISFFLHVRLSAC